LGFPIWPGNEKTFVNIGAVVTAFVTFLITAAVVYFIFVAPMNRINTMVKKRVSPAEPEEAPLPADTALLAEIRDLLAQLAGTAGTAHTGAQPQGQQAAEDQATGSDHRAETSGQHVR
jgi:large conductance mechanosensitive channel